MTLMLDDFVTKPCIVFIYQPTNQEVQQERYFQLPASICRLFIGVITNLLGQPADLPVLKAICSFLIAIHPTLDTLTLHSAQNFYLIGKVHSKKIDMA